MIYKIIKMKKILLFIFLIIFSLVRSQEIATGGSLIKTGIEDGAKLIDAYITPINKAVVYGLSNVTYTKIKKEQEHRLLISLEFVSVKIPTEDLNFDVNRIGLTNFEPKNPDLHISPTVFGDSLAGITLVSTQKNLLGEPLIEFNTPGGGQKSAFPLGFLAASYRLKYTGFNFRFIPYMKVPTTDLYVGMLGAGVQQSLSAMIVALRESAWDVSVQGGASILLGNVNLDVKPGGVYIPVTVTGQTTGPYDNQKIRIAYTSIYAGTYIDYTIKDKFTFFAGAGYNLGVSSIKVKGTYPVYTSDPLGWGSVVASDVDNPLALQNNFSRIKFDTGVRVDGRQFFVQLNYNIAMYGGWSLKLGYKMQ